jgi:hypothetical protein
VVLKDPNFALVQEPISELFPQATNEIAYFEKPCLSILEKFDYMPLTVKSQ